MPSKKIKKAKASPHQWGDVYPTFGKYVFLGKRPPRWVVQQAQCAGLEVVDKTRFKHMLYNTQAIQRLFAQGQWSNSVRYNAL